MIRALVLFNTGFALAAAPNVVLSGCLDRGDVTALCNLAASPLGEAMNVGGSLLAVGAVISVVCSVLREFVGQ